MVCVDAYDEHRARDLLPPAKAEKAWDDVKTIVDASKRMAHEAVRARFAALQQGPDPT